MPPTRHIGVASHQRYDQEIRLANAKRTAGVDHRGDDAEIARWLAGHPVEHLDPDPQIQTAQQWRAPANSGSGKGLS